MGTWGLRLRAFVDNNFLTIVAVLVVLAAVGGWFTYATFVDQPTTTEERTVASWQATGEFDHGATVARNNSVYPVGERLSNRTVYFTGVAPELDGTFGYYYRASDGGNLTATVTKRVVLRGVEQTGARDEPPTELWRVTRPLGQRQVDALAPGEAVYVRFAVNVSELGNRTEQIREELGTGETHVAVQTTVHVQGTVNGQAVNNTTQYALQIQPQEKTYRVDDPGAVEAAHERTTTVEVAESPGPVRQAVSLLLLALPLGLVVGLGAARSQNRAGLSTLERDRLAYEADRADFDDWISTVRLPEEAFDRPEAEASSLSALVDFAIDTDGAVVEDPDSGAFHVVHGDYLYTYEPPELNTASPASATELRDADDPELELDQQDAALVEDGDGSDDE